MTPESTPDEVALRAANRVRAAVDDLNVAFDEMWDAGAHDLAETIANVRAAGLGVLTDIERWADGA
jgi:hypothetical protein